MQWPPTDRQIRWAFEILGVLTVAIAASLWWLPLGIGVVGVYLLTVANVGFSEGGTDDDSAQDSSS